MLMLEKTVHLEGADLNSNIRFHSPFFCQPRFRSYRPTPHREKSRKIPPNAKEINPFKTNQ